MAYEMAAVLFAPKTIEGAAKNFDELVKTLQSELITVGFNPRAEVDSGGNYFKLKAGFGVSAKVYYRPVGKDVILTPEARGSSWVWLLCIIGLCPGLIGFIIRDRNVKKTIRRLPTVLEAVNSIFKAQSPPSPPSQTLKNCNSCGAEMGIEDEYCVRCGKKQ